MKKTIFLISAFSIFTVSFAQEDINIKNFYYELGKKEALKQIEKIKKEYYQKGYQEALKEVKRNLEKYVKYIEAIERGKYMIKNKMITYPQVYVIYQNNTAYIKILPPKVEKMYNIDEIIKGEINE